MGCSIGCNCENVRGRRYGAFDLIPAPYLLFAAGVLLVVIVGGSAAIAWQVQGWRHVQLARWRQHSISWLWLQRLNNVPSKTSI